MANYDWSKVYEDIIAALGADPAGFNRQWLTEGGGADAQRTGQWQMSLPQYEGMNFLGNGDTLQATYDQQGRDYSMQDLGPGGAQGDPRFVDRQSAGASFLDAAKGPAMIGAAALLGPYAGEWLNGVAGAGSAGSAIGAGDAAWWTPEMLEGMVPGAGTAGTGAGTAATGAGAVTGGGFVGEGVASGIPAWDAAAKTAGLTLPGAVTGASSLLKDLAPVLGAVAGAASSQDEEQTTTREPWGPAQDWIKANITRGQNLQKQYEDNPFSPQQQTAYNNVGGLLNTLNTQMPGLLGGFNATGSGANNFDRSNPRRQLTGSTFDPAAFQAGLLNFFPR